MAASAVTWFYEVISSVIVSNLRIMMWLIVKWQWMLVHIFSICHIVFVWLIMISDDIRVMATIVAIRCVYPICAIIIFEIGWNRLIEWMTWCMRIMFTKFRCLIVMIEWLWMRYQWMMRKLITTRHFITNSTTSTGWCCIITRWNYMALIIITKRILTMWRWGITYWTI